MSSNTCLLVFTRDLRVHDNPALEIASKNYKTVIPVFVFIQELLFGENSSPNRTAYLLESLDDLDRNLKAMDSQLFTLEGDWVQKVSELALSLKVDAIAWARDVNQFGQDRDTKLKNFCTENEIVSHCVDSHTVVAPDALSPASSSTPREFKVFTPYYNKWLEVPKRTAFAPPRKLEIDKSIISEIATTKLEFDSSETSPFREKGGETLARKNLNSWVKNDLEKYEDNHNDLAGNKTSHIGSALHFGTLSANEICVKLASKKGSAPFIRQICWRDFYHQILFYNPQTENEDYVDRGENWNVDEKSFELWCEGKTGYPIVDAAMRQLKLEGFMHNRARMIVASFLTKDLYIDWRLGAKWFNHWLTDGDIANNNLNWQWVAGTGTDTNPHRIFNPIRQSERFDPEGVYIKKYVPELSAIEAKDIHFPHHLRDRLDSAHLLEDYPLPIVDHAQAISIYKNRK